MCFFDPEFFLSVVIVGNFEYCHYDRLLVFKNIYLTMLLIVLFMSRKKFVYEIKSSVATLIQRSTILTG